MNRYNLRVFTVCLAIFVISAGCGIIFVRTLTSRIRSQIPSGSASTHEAPNPLDANDPEIAIALQTSKQTLGTFVTRLLRPEKFDKKFSVLVSFSSAQGTENLWVGNPQFDDPKSPGKDLTGTLDQDPQFYSAKKGDSVRFEVARIMDWKIEHQNGSLEGNFLAAALKRKQELQ